MDDQPNLFERFGGIRPMAEALNERPSTVQSWKTAGRVPSTKQPEVLARACALGIDVIPRDVIFPLDRRPLGKVVTPPAALVPCDQFSVSKAVSA
jgi:hypothetical protein